jgi:hypothetical protein
VARRTDVVDRRVQRLHTGLADVADLETTCPALMRGCHGAATTAEVTFSALCGWLSAAGLAAVVPRGALRALGDVREAVAGTVCAVGAQELGRVAGTLRAVAAGRAGLWCGGFVQTIRTRWARLNKQRIATNYDEGCT